MSTLRRFSSLLLLGLVTLASTATAQRASQRGPLDGFDQYVTNAIRELEHAGIAIAVVKNDSIVYAKGFGVRAIGKPDPIDANTIFAIGSSTKAFAGLSVAMLVDEGKMSWDEPVATYLPGFRLYDPYVSQQITMRDALTHRSGLARTDLVWISGQFTSEELIRRLRFVKPAGPFRQEYGYQNLMYLAAGMAVAKVAGTPTWSDFVTQRILLPLGMRESSPSIKGLAGKTNVAEPHARINDTLRTVPARDIDHVAPAGSINSNVLDMAQWLRFQLNGGKVNGKALLGQRAFDETRTPQFTMRRGGGGGGGAQPAERDGYFSAYGMGWFLQDYKGRFVVHHGGNIDGMTALVALMPDENLGVVALTNMNGSPLPTALTYTIFDRFLGLPAKDRVAEIKEQRARAATRVAQQQAETEAKRVKNTMPTLTLDRYAGTYADSANGELKVTLENGKLVVRYGTQFTGDLEHWNYDTFRAAWRNLALFSHSMVNFTIGRDGTPSTVSLDNFGEFGRSP